MKIVFLYIVCIYNIILDKPPIVPSPFKFLPLDIWTSYMIYLSHVQNPQILYRSKLK